MTPHPCSVCGGTDMNLIDGFYYCVECGTQDVNAQETVVEHTMLADGTFAHAATRKITRVLKDAIEMTGEWHKWHAFNFILVGLVDELVNLGASTGFRDTVLWIWTRYLKEFMDKNQMRTITEIKEGRVNHKSLFVYEDEIEEDQIDKNDDDYRSDDSTRKKTKKEAQRKKEKKKREQDRNSIKIVTKGLLIAIMYVALNLDRSDIQLSHLLRFIREGRLSFSNSTKFVPKELNLKSVPHWKNFMNCNKDHYYSATNIRQTAMTLIKVLDLGKPLVPNLRKMAENYVKELCLPNDFKNLVFSLMHQVPCDHLDVDYSFAKKTLIRTPDFEGIVMSYVLVALKMTFGLDDQYEITMSKTVEKINEEENRLKSYKLGRYSEPSDRLFSFNEWSRYLQFRKILLCKHYLPMAQQNNLDVDDRVFIEQLGERQKRKKVLSDEITMDILDKIVPTDEGNVIPKSEFITTLTPLADFTELILHYIQDPEVKLLISEDFTQYSLKYACEEMKLLNGEDNIITGVSEENKTINKVIVGNLISKENDYSLVFVRNCENPNWLKTNPPTIDHITKVQEIMTDRNSDQGYDSNLESNSTEIDGSNVSSLNNKEELKELETIEEEKEGVSIFDDQFNDIEHFDEEDKTEPECNSFQSNTDNAHHSSGEFENDPGRDINDECSMREVKFNLETFNRPKIIKELILAACKKYKIPIPKEYNPTGPRKRNSAFILDETGELVRKKRKLASSRTKRGAAQDEINEIMTAYYANMEKELLEKVSEHLNFVVKDFVDLERSKEGNSLDDEISNENNVIYNKAQLFDDNINEFHEENNDLNKTADSSIREVEADTESETNDLIPKVNPDFDEKTHDVKQLYVKYSQGLCFENIIDDDDAEIDKILEKKIEECKLNEPIAFSAKDLKHQMEESDEEEEDRIFQAQLLQRGLKLEPLIKNPEDIREFKYWRRNYTSLFMRKNIDRKEKFDFELSENFPKSFIFVVRECAAILDCTAFSLYKHLQNLEQVLFK